MHTFAVDNQRGRSVHAPSCHYWIIVVLLSWMAYISAKVTATLILAPAMITNAVAFKELLLFIIIIIIVCISILLNVPIAL